MSWLRSFGRRVLFAGIPKEAEDYSKDLRDAWIRNLQRLNVCSQKGLVERFDSTIGAGTVADAFRRKIPAHAFGRNGGKDSGTGRRYKHRYAYGFWVQSFHCKMESFHGAMFAVIESVAKIVAMGGNHKKNKIVPAGVF